MYPMYYGNLCQHIAVNFKMSKLESLRDCIANYLIIELIEKVEFISWNLIVEIIFPQVKLTRQEHQRFCCYQSLFQSE